MTKETTKVPVNTGKSQKTASPAAQPPATMDPWRPLASLREEMDRLFDSFDRSYWRSPFRSSALDIQPFLRGELNWGAAPAIDIVENDKAFEVTAELPGMEDKDIDVTVANGSIVIKGEKQEETEEEKKDYFLRERRFGSFERRFALPEGVDADKIGARFAKGVLTVTLPKTPEAKKSEKKIKVKTA